MSNQASAKPEALSYLTSSKTFLLEAPLYYPFDLSVESIAKLIFQFFSLPQQSMPIAYIVKERAYSRLTPRAFLRR
jgi:hypothetical protein